MTKSNPIAKDATTIGESQQNEPITVELLAKALMEMRTSHENFRSDTRREFADFRGDIVETRRDIVAVRSDLAEMKKMVREMRMMLTSAINEDRNQSDSHQVCVSELEHGCRSRDSDDIPIFNGEELRSWISWMEDYFARDDFTELQKLAMAYGFISGKAESYVNWRQSIMLIDTWDEMKEVLLLKFGDVDDPEWIKRVTENRKFLQELVGRENDAQEGETIESTVPIQDVNSKSIPSMLWNSIHEMEAISATTPDKIGYFDDPDKIKLVPEDRGSSQELVTRKIHDHERETMESTISIQDVDSKLMLLDSILEGESHYEPSPDSESITVQEVSIGTELIQANGSKPENFPQHQVHLSLLESGHRDSLLGDVEMNVLVEEFHATLWLSFDASKAVKDKILSAGNLNMVAYQVYDRMLLRKHRLQQRKKGNLSPKSWKFKFKGKRLNSDMPQIGQHTLITRQSWKNKFETLYKISRLIAEVVQGCNGQLTLNTNGSEPLLNTNGLENWMLGLGETHPGTWITLVEGLCHIHKYAEAQNLGVVPLNFKGYALTWCMKELSRAAFKDESEFKKRLLVRYGTIQCSSPSTKNMKTGFISSNEDTLERELIQAKRLMTWAVSIHKHELHAATLQELPTRGIIVGNIGILDAYRIGLGRVVARGKAEVGLLVPNTKRNAVVITTITYQQMKHFFEGIVMRFDYMGFVLQSIKEASSHSSVVVTALQSGYILFEEQAEVILEITLRTPTALEHIDVIPKDYGSAILEDIDVIPKEEMMIAISEEGSLKGMLPVTFNLQQHSSFVWHRWRRKDSHTYSCIASNFYRSFALEDKLRLCDGGIDRSKRVY